MMLSGLLRQGHKRTLAAILAGLAPAMAGAHPPQAAPPLVCESKANERIVCPADTTAGVALMKSTGPAACLLGKTWGYDDAGVWVANGCGGTSAEVPVWSAGITGAGSAPSCGGPSK